MTRNRHKNSWSKKKKAGLVGIILLIVVAVLIVVGAVIASRILGAFNYSATPGGNIGGDPNGNDVVAPPLQVKDKPVEINDNATSLSEIALQGDTKNISNILLLGIDNVSTSETIKSHSDTNMILSINRNDNTIRMASLMRDTYVWNDEGTKQYKLNAAFYEGGFAEIQKVLMNQYRIQIDRVVAINFSVFSKLVDEIDGIDISLSDAEIANMKKELKSTPSSNGDGTYHLNGAQALAFARNRTTATADNKLRDDFGRTSRQRQTIEAILKKAKTLNPAKLLSAVDTVVRQTHTNFSQDEIVNYLAEAPALLKHEIKGFNYPNYGEFTPDDVRVYGNVLKVNDPVKLALRLHHELYD